MAFESIDGRTHKFIAYLSDGSRQESPVKLAGMVLDAGVFRSGGSYERWDFATYGGSGWIAQVDTKATPGTNSDWRLAVKKGRDGKDGASE